MFVALNKKEICKAVKEAVSEVFDQYETESRHVILDAGDCFPIMLAKNVVGLDGSFKTSFVVSEARKAALNLFCAFIDETDYDADKMIAIANFYEDLLRQGKYGHLDANYHKTYLLDSMLYDDFRLMDNLDCETYDNQHRLYLVTVTERFVELVRYLELLKETGKEDFHDITEDRAFLHLVWKYDKDSVPFDLDCLLFDDIDDDAYWDDLDWSEDEEDDEDFFGDEDLLDEDTEGSDEEDADDWLPPYFSEMGKVFEAFEEGLIEVDDDDKDGEPEAEESDRMEYIEE